MKKLKEWLKEHGIKHYVFAKMIGVSAGYMSYILKGEREVSYPVALAIEYLTDGDVCFEDLRGEERYGLDVMHRWKSMR